VFSGIGQMLMAADRLRVEDAREQQSGAEERPASPRPWGVSVTPSVRLIPPGGSDADSDAESQVASDLSQGVTSARPAPQSKSRPAGKPKKSGRASSASQRRTTGGAKSGSPAKPGSVSKAGTAKPGTAKPGTTAKPGSGQSGGRASRKAAPPPSRFRSLDSTGNVRMLSAEDVADLTQAARRPGSGPSAPSRSITGSARPAESALPAESTRPAETPRSDGWPQYPMADYKSPSGTGFGSSSSQADPVAAAAESVTSFAELATLLGNGRIAPAEPTEPTEPVATAEPAAATEPVAGTEPAATAATAEIAEEPADTGTADTGEPLARGTELPIAGYDELSLPSLRARLRNLDVDQLRVLVDHERSHANRADVVSMFERRIVKLNDGSA
jgi:hypothetical protein